MTKRFTGTVLLAVAVSSMLIREADADSLLKVDFGTAAFSPVQPGFLNMNGPATAATASQVFGVYTVNLEGQGFFNTVNNGSAANLNPIVASIKDFYRDYYFMNNSTNDPTKAVTLSISGLVPNAPYNLTLWSFDADRTVAGATTNTWTPFNDTSGSPSDIIVQNSPSPLDLTTNSTTIATSSPTGVLAVRGTSSVGPGGIRLNGFKIDNGTTDLLAVDFGQQLTASAVQPGFVGMTGVGLQPQHSQTIGAYTVTVSANSVAVGNRSGYFSAADATGNLVDAGVRDFYRDFYYNNSNSAGEGITLMIEGVIPNTEYDLTLWSYDVDRTAPLEATPVDWSPSGSDTTGTTGNVSIIREPLPTQLVDEDHSITIRVKSTTSTLTVFGARSGGTTGNTRLNGFELKTAELLGDYNGNGTVDAADYVVWRKNDGSQSGYEIWRANFGNGVGGGVSAGQAAAVPEPSAVVMSVVPLAIVTLRSLQRKRQRVSNAN